MPRTFLTRKERERLTGFPDALPQWDLLTSFTLTEHDGSLIATSQSAPNRLGTALQRCAVRDLGLCPTALHAAPSDVITCLANQPQVEPDALQDYGKRHRTRRTHCNAVLHHLELRRVHPDDHQSIVDGLTERAREHAKLPLLLHMLCERLKQPQLLRPAVTTVERWVVTARMQAHQESFNRLQPLRTPERMTVLDSLLIAESEQGPSPLYRLRQHADTNTPTALLHTLDQLILLESWDVDTWAMSALHPNRQKLLARLGRQDPLQALRRMGPERR